MSAPYKLHSVPHAPHAPLRSSFAGDPDMAELVAEYADELKQRAESIEAAWTAGDLPTLRTLSHQLKGSAGGYGFDLITDAAGRLESSLKRHGMSAPVTQLRALTTLCRLAAA